MNGFLILLNAAGSAGCIAVWSVTSNPVTLGLGIWAGFVSLWIMSWKED